MQFNENESKSVVDIDAPQANATTWPLHPPHELTSARKGEMYFNDGTLCYQGWQSCASCHSSDARVDGMNWDLHLDADQINDLATYVLSL